MNGTLESLTKAACTIAMRGAAEYLNRKNLKATPEAMSACLKAWVKIKLPEAMHDCREALKCNMGQVAETTFAASMIQAGIEAAKEAGIPVGMEGA